MKKRDFLTAKVAGNFCKGRKGNNAGDINFATFAVSQRSLRLNSVLTNRKINI
jgi:hypothetical protein